MFIIVSENAFWCIIFPGRYMCVYTQSSLMCFISKVCSPGTIPANKMSVANRYVSFHVTLSEFGCIASM